VGAEKPTQARPPRKNKLKKEIEAEAETAAQRLSPSFALAIKAAHPLILLRNLAAVSRNLSPNRNRAGSSSPSDLCSR
jgi:hypothetical protein